MRLLDAEVEKVAVRKSRQGHRGCAGGEGGRDHRDHILLAARRGGSPRLQDPQVLGNKEAGRQAPQRGQASVALQRRSPEQADLCHQDRGQVRGSSGSA